MAENVSVYDQNIIIYPDVLLIIISYLGINDILALTRVCKEFYGICRSNYVWGPKLFGNITTGPPKIGTESSDLGAPRNFAKQSSRGPSEKTFQMFYQNNKPYFLNYFYFRNYVDIDYKMGSTQCNYFDLFRNICTLIPDLRAPYKHDEIINDIRTIYDQMVADGFKYDEFIYTVRAVDNIPFYNKDQYIWKYRTTTENCELLIILRKNKNNKIKFQKYVKPFNVPVTVIKKMKIIMYAETVDRLFKK